MHAHRAVGFGSDLKAPILMPTTPVRAPKPFVSEAFEDLIEDRRGMLGDAENFRIERGHERGRGGLGACGGLHEDERHFADDEVAIRRPIDAAEPGGGGAQTRQRQNGAAEIEEERPWIVAQSGEARF